MTPLPFLLHIPHSSPPPTTHTHNSYILPSSSSSYTHTHTHTHTERGTQPKEEESIKDVVRSTFETVWFLPPPNHATFNLNNPKKQLTRKSSNNSILDDIKTEIKIEIKNEVNAKSCYNNNNNNDNSNDVNNNNCNDKIKNENGKDDNNNNNNDNKNLNISIGKIDDVKIIPGDNNSPVPVPILLGPQRALDLHVTATAHQIVDVMGDGSSSTWLIQLLREMLHGKREGNEFQNQVQGRRNESLVHCGRLVENLIEMLLKSEEREEVLMKAIEGKRTVQNHIVAVVVTMAVFVEAHPPFAIPHLSILLPYLKVKIR